MRHARYMRPRTERRAEDESDEILTKKENELKKLKTAVDKIFDEDLRDTFHEALKKKLLEIKKKVDPELFEMITDEVGDDALLGYIKGNLSVLSEVPKAVCEDL